MDILIYLIGATITFSVSIYNFYLDCKKKYISKDKFIGEICDLFLFGFILWFAYLPYVGIKVLFDTLYKKFMKEHIK